MSDRKETVYVKDERLDGGTVARHTQTGESQKEAGFNLSWGAIFAGIVTFIALLITFSLINAALGFGQFTPTDPNPFNNVGTGQAIWTVIALILSFLGAGFVSGLTARRMGVVHGFLTWAGSLIFATIMIVWVVSSALSTVGSVVSTTASVAGDAVSSVASSAGDAVTNGVNALADNIDVNQADIDQLNEDVQSALEETDIPELQPEYISAQVDGATTDIANAAQEIILNPDNSDQIFSDLADSLSSRVSSITENIDEQAVANAVEGNTELTQAEAEQVTQNIIDGYNQVAQSARQGLEAASNAIQDTQASLNQSIEDLRVGAEDATNSVSSGSVWAFVGVVLGALISVAGGYLGVNTVTRYATEDKI